LQFGAPVEFFRHGLPLTLTPKVVKVIRGRFMIIDIKKSADDKL